MRTLNNKKLSELQVIHGKLWREFLAVESKIPYVKIVRLLKGERVASEIEMDSLCRATGLTKGELFPIFDEKKQSA